MRETCSNCGLDYKFVDTGDGPAVFAIFILGFLIVGGALIAEFKFGIPFWAHVAAVGHPHAADRNLSAALLEGHADRAPVQEQGRGRPSVEGVMP